MATEADIEMVETFTPKNFDDRSSTQESKSEDDDKDKDASIGDRNDVHKSDRKIGHRRVGVGGEITYKKVPTTQIMGSIQLGIQHAVGGLASKPERDLLMQDFMTVETTNFPHEGSNHTPAHHYSEFKFKTYAPIAFRYFRDLFGIQPDDFLMSFCSSPLRELSNPGASGSIFYLTEDDEFIIKTVQHKEGEFLQKLLPGYYMNLNQNPRTLLPKFFGLYCYQCNSKNVRLVAMNNLLPSVVKLHQKYDLKGSTYKRKASKSERNKKSPTYKDLDFMEHHPQGLFLEADTHGALVKTIQRDCRVLESFKIMDYSLLVGVHNLDKAQREKAEELAAEGRAEEEGAAGERSMLTRTRSEQKTKEDFSNQVRRTQSINRQRLVAHSTAMESIQAESEPIDEEEDVPPGGIPARNEKGERLLLFVGVIDILQSYRFRKKLEHTWKSMIHDGDTVSVHRPNFYAQRFQDFMAKKVFMKIPSLDLPEIKGNHRKFRTLVTSYIALKHSPSKRKSISRPLRQQEDLETSGAGTSSNVNQLHLPTGPDSLPSYQFPRVLWADPSARPPRALDTPEVDEEDDSFPRIPSPGSAAMRAFWGSDVDAFYEHNAGTSKLDSSTPKSGNHRKISFAVDRGDNYLRCDSAMSSASSSIAEAMKDMPFIDGTDESFGDKSAHVGDGQSDTMRSQSLNVNKSVATDVKKTVDKETKVKIGSNNSTPEKSGFFGRFKKALVGFFVGEEEENKGVGEVVDTMKDNSGKNDSLRRASKNFSIEKRVSKIDDETVKRNASVIAQPPIVDTRNLGSFKIDTVVQVEVSKANDTEALNASYFAEECSNDNFVVMSYKENQIDIAEDIGICTDFAEGNSLVTEIDASWLRARRSKSLSRDPRTKAEMDLEGIFLKQKLLSFRARKREAFKALDRLSQGGVPRDQSLLVNNNKVTIKEYNEKGILKAEEVIKNDTNSNDVSGKLSGPVFSDDDMNLIQEKKIWGTDDEILKFDEQMMNNYDEKVSNK